MIDNLFNLIFRCPHRHLTRPITPLAAATAGSGTYMRCLDCGKAFAYDAREMKIGKMLVELGAGDASGTSANKLRKHYKVAAIRRFGNTAGPGG